jgi:hypothetical protein
MSEVKAYPSEGEMVDGYQYEEPITFDGNGWMKSGQFPADCIRDCSAGGSVDEAVRYWRVKLSFAPPRGLMVSYLKEYGAWDDLESSEGVDCPDNALASDETLAERVLWLACVDIREQGEWLGVCC